MSKSELSLPPQVARTRAFIDSPRMFKDPIEIFSKYTADFGDTFTFHFGGVKKAIVTSNPGIIQHIFKTNYHNYQKSEIQVRRMGHFLGSGLLTSHGRYWRTQRRLIQQGFHRAQLAALMQIMQGVLDESIGRFEADLPKGPIDIYQQMMKFTFRIACRSLFSTKLKEEQLDFISNSISVIQEFICRQILQPYLNPWFRISGELRKFEQMRIRSDTIIRDYIESRRQERQEHNDLLQILLDARYEDTGEGMTDEQVLMESMQLLAAGHETSSNALSWVLYLLSKHPDALKRIRFELNTVLGDAPVQFSDLPKLEYTSQVLDESMRIYPPFWMIDRFALEDDKVLDIDIPKGTTVVAYIYGLHHSPEHWQDPETFLPERFTKENKETHTPFSHLPFGGGPRVCIGSNYAQMQMLMILSVLLRNFDFELVPDRKIEMHPMVILRPEDGFEMYFSKRKGQSVAAF